MKNFKINFIALLIGLLFTLPLQAQNKGVSINETGNPPDNSAILDVQSTDKGMLIPRVTIAQRLAFPNKTQGLTVYQTDDVKGFYYYDGTKWQQLASQEYVEH